MDNINLVPQAEVQEQRKSKLVSMSTVLAIFVLVLAVGTSAYFVYSLNTLNEKSKSLDVEINSLREEVKGMVEVEVKARNLAKKYNVVKIFFEERVLYSSFLEELQYRQPEDLLVDSLDVRSGSANVSGTADSYLSIARFINNLLEEGFESDNSDLEGVFTAVSLKSVNLESSTNKVKYFIVISFDTAKLRSI